MLAVLAVAAETEPQVRLVLLIKGEQAALVPARAVLVVAVLILLVATVQEIMVATAALG